jgi:hypothetical protein
MLEFLLALNLYVLSYVDKEGVSHTEHHSDIATCVNRQWDLYKQGMIITKPC